MKNLHYSRAELPVSCPTCGNSRMGEKFIARDTYTEIRESYCEICKETYNVNITED